MRELLDLPGPDCDGRCLYTLDEAKADEYFDKLLANDLVWRTGNAHVMRDVSQGLFAFGWTDTDDFRVAQLKGLPVACVYPDAGEGEEGVLYIGTDDGN